MSLSFYHHFSHYHHPSTPTPLTPSRPPVTASTTTTIIINTITSTTIRATTWEDGLRHRSLAQNAGCLWHHLNRSRVLPMDDISAGQDSLDFCLPRQKTYLYTYHTMNCAEWTTFQKKKTHTYKGIRYHNNSPPRDELSAILPNRGQVAHKSFEVYPT